MRPRLTLSQTIALGLALILPVGLWAVWQVGTEAWRAWRDADEGLALAWLGLALLLGWGQVQVGQEIGELWRSGRRGGS